MPNDAYATDPYVDPYAGAAGSTSQSAASGQNMDMQDDVQSLWEIVDETPEERAERLAEANRLITMHELEEMDLENCPDDSVNCGRAVKFLFRNSGARSAEYHNMPLCMDSIAESERFNVINNAGAHSSLDLICPCTCGTFQTLWNGLEADIQTEAAETDKQVTETLEAELENDPANIIKSRMTPLATITSNMLTSAPFDVCDDWDAQHPVPQTNMLAQITSIHHHGVHAGPQPQQQDQDALHAAQIAGSASSSELTSSSSTTTTISTTTTSTALSQPNVDFEELDTNEADHETGFVTDGPEPQFISVGECVAQCMPCVQCGMGRGKTNLCVQCSNPHHPRTRYCSTCGAARLLRCVMKEMMTNNIAGIASPSASNHGSWIFKAGSVY